MARRTRIDMSRVAAAAVDAAFDNGQPRRHRLSGVRAVAAGAALAAVARVAVKKAPGFMLPNVPSVSDLTSNVRDRLAESGWIDHEEFVDEEEPVDEVEEWDESDDEEADEEDEGPDDEDDGWEDEDDEDTDDGGPEAAGDDDWDEDDEEDEGEAAEDEEPQDEPAPSIELGQNGGDSGPKARRTPDLLSALSPHSRPPVMEGGEEQAEPAERPPEHPKRDRSSARKSKSKAGKR